MNIRNGLLIGFLLAIGCQAALAEGRMMFDDIDPTVSYSGLRLVETRDTKMKMRVYHAPGRTRFEMNAQGQEMVMLQHSDTGDSWMLMPQMQMYMQSSAEEVARNSGSALEIIEQTEVGSEEVNGFAVTKYKAVFRDAEGRQGSGHFWVTDEHGIPVRIDMIQETAQGKQRIYMELQDLQIGSQPDSLFEVPDSYRAMPGNMGGMSMPGMGGSSGMPPGGGQGMSGDDYMEQLAQRREQKKQEEEASRAREKAEKEALSRLTQDYLEGCWFPTREAAQIKINADGSYEVGTPAGSGYAMSKMGDSIEEFRQRFKGLVSKSDDRFVTRGTHRETTYERGECVVGSHAVAGPGNSAQESTDKNAVDKAADKVKKGIGSLFDRFGN